MAGLARKSEETPTRRPAAFGHGAAPDRSGMSEATFLRVGGIDLELQDWPGAPLPVLMLHEALGSLATWRGFPARMAASTGRQVVAWSRPGHGRSAVPTQARGFDYLEREAERVRDLFGALGIARAHLYGHSDGATIALLTAALFPGVVASLSLEAPHVMVEQQTIDGTRHTENLFRSSDLRERLGRYHDDVDHVFWSWNNIWLDPAFRAWNVEKLISLCRCPTLLIQGLDDPYGTVAQIDRIAAAIPGTQRLELAGCRHNPHREATETVLQAVASFVAETGE